MTRLELAIEAGLDKIYCSNTGIQVGTLTTAELEAFIEMEDRLHGFDSDDEFLDHLSLAMIPMSSRPSPLFQNMTPDRYRVMASAYPEHLFRFLLGRLVFERWNQVQGYVLIEGKVEWLKTVDLVDFDYKPTLETLIRLDGILSLRKVYYDDETVAQMAKIRDNWPGIIEIAMFVDKLESENIKRLSLHDQVVFGTIRGNPMARSAALEQVKDVNMEEFQRVHTERRLSELMNLAIRENRSREEKNKINRRYSALLGTGQTAIKRGVEAIYDLAAISGVFDKGIAMELVAKMDTSKIGVKKIQEKAVAKIQKKTSNRQPKTTFDIDFNDLGDL